MKAFEMIRHWDEQPVTVFAADLPQAEDICRTWVRAHHPEWGEAPMMVHTYEGKLLEERPLLASAAKLEIAGVGNFDATLGIWFIAGVDEPPEGPTGTTKPWSSGARSTKL